MPWNNFDYLNWLRQNRLSERHLVQPVFEAIENAFNAIEESSRSDGSVTILVHRDLRQRTIAFDSTGKRAGVPTAPRAIEIVDNGVGFDSANWNAFETIFTPHKMTSGGKGMGRLTYLLAFNEATFESRFHESGADFVRRFTLSRSEHGTSESKVTPITGDDIHGTRVILSDLDARAQERFPKKLDAIARHIVVHFFKRLSLADGIPCELRDDWDDSVIDLRQFCRDQLVLRHSSEPVEILGKPYTITHLRARRRVADRHEVHFCANGRVVCSKELPTAFSVTRDPLTSAEGEFFYAAFLEGAVLDGAARTDRLSFNLEEDEPHDAIPDPNRGEYPSLQSLLAESGQRARSHLADVLDPLENTHRERIVAYCKRNVAYRPLLKHRMDELMRIPIGVNEDDFSQAVSRVYHAWKANVRVRFRDMARTVRENAADLMAHREGYREILRNFGELTFHELAAYVIDRRAVIDFLWKKLAVAPNGRFSDEDAIHDIFFPRRQTSDDLAWDESNLWLIDERLAYQQFVASDIDLPSQGYSNTTWRGRPDVAVYYDRFYDATFAFAEGDLPFTSVTLVEFKKPERTQYSHIDNPIQQVLKYVNEIRANEVLTADGHRFRITEATPIHVHVICHIVDELKPFLAAYQYIETPDGGGIVFHAPRLNTLIQMTSFEKIISDARKRNDVFFRKLGVDAEDAVE